MTTASLPHGHSAPTPARRATRLLFASLLALATAPALAAGPSNGAASVPPAEVLKAVAPVALATPDTAPAAAPQQAEAADAPSTPGKIRTVLQRAFALLGTPYRWGGSSPEGGFDCSGLVGYVFRTIGVDLPRVSRAMAQEGTPVTDRHALAEGDLVFFGKRGKVDHVGIYIGDGKFLHAPRTGRDVTVSTLESGYWSQKYLSARRIAAGS